MLKKKYNSPIIISAMKRYFLIIPLLALLVSSCVKPPKNTEQETVTTLKTFPDTEGTPIRIDFTKGEEFYYPLIVFWIEDEQGNYIETIYASQSIATGVFKFGVNDKGKWAPGERRRSAALPYWGHKRGFKAPDGLFLPTPRDPLPDAITGATPKTNFVVNSFVKPDLKKFRLMMEINQTWDWNNHWHNNLYPDDEEYKTSCQPALVYMVEVDVDKIDQVFDLKPIGHSHHSGETGELFPDISTFTTALQIAEKVTVRVEKVD